VQLTYANKKKVGAIKRHKGQNKQRNELWREGQKVSEAALTDSENLSITSGRREVSNKSTKVLAKDYHHSMSCFCLFRG
jgi:hypothetical protein